MGSAVSAVSNAVSGAVSSISGGGGGILSSSNPVGSLISSGINPLAGAAGDGLGTLAGGIIKAIPDVPIADQSQLQNQIGQANNIQSKNLQQQQQQQAEADYQLKAASGAIQGSSQNAINAANNQNLGSTSNVAQSLDLIRGQANGTAPSAAQAQLQIGKDQAIATQQAMANSGNLSQQISGQKTAMDNAANLTQQAANAATQLQATQQQVGQQNYANAAAQQANTANTNAGLQQNQVAQQIAIGNVQNNAAQGYAGQLNAANANALGAQQGALGIQQTALGQTGQNKAMAVGGVLNAAGSAGAAAALSDENSKKDIKKTDKISDFLDAIDPVSFEYKEATGEMGKTPGEHLGVIAQQVEKAPGGKSMIIDTPQGKGIDLASAVGALLAAATENHNRVKELEDLFKSKMKKKDKK